MPFSHQNKFTVALAVTIINLGWALPAEAQDDERPPTRSTAPVSTPVTSDGPTVLECLPLAGQICPTPEVDRDPPPPPQQPRPRACVWGRIVGANGQRLSGVRTHEAASMVVGGVVMQPGHGLPATVDTGIGGNCVCGDGEFYLPADADHTPRRAVQNLDTVGRLARTGNEICLPRVGEVIENAPPVGVDLGPIIIWLGELEGSACVDRATDICQNLIHDLNACEATAQAARDNAAFEACFTQHHYTGSVTIPEGDVSVGGLSTCAGMTFECSRFGVNYAPVPALPSDEVGEGGQGQGPSIDIAVDLGASAFATGIRASSVEANAAIQFALQPSTAMIAPTVRLRLGYGRMNDQGGIEIQQPMRLHLGLGVQAILTERVRLDVLATTGAIMSQNTNSNGNGDGIRADRGIGAELGLSIDLNRRGQLDTGVGLVPYLRLNAEVMSLRYNLANDQAEANYIRRTSYGFGVSFGIRFGQRGRR